MRSSKGANIRQQSGPWFVDTANESPRTTKLYDRTNDRVSLDEVERVVF